MSGAVPSRPASAVTIPRTLTIDPTDNARTVAIESWAGVAVAVGVGVTVGVGRAVGAGLADGAVVGVGEDAGVGAGVGDDVATGGAVGLGLLLATSSSSPGLAASTR